MSFFVCEDDKSRTNLIGFGRSRTTFSVSDEEPGIEEYRDLIYLPTVNALYRLDGSIVKESRRIHFDETMPQIKTSDLFRRKMEGMYPSQITVPKDIRIEESPVTLLGNNSGHWGHFLLEGLSRMWAVTAGHVDPRKELILFTNSTKRAGFSDTMFDALGIDPGAILYPTQPTLYRSVRVVSPSINHIFQIYSRFSDVHHEIAAKIGSGRRFDRPVFISRADVPGTIHAFLNEDKIEADLNAKGFETIHPEKLSVPDQIALFSTCPLIVGSIGSAFHSILFDSGSNKIRVMMSPENIGPRFPMVDAVCHGHKSYYLNVMPKVTERGQVVSIDVDKARDMLKAIGVL